MHTQPLNVVCTTHTCVRISSSQKAISVVMLSASLVNNSLVHSIVLNFARQYQFSDSKESKEKIKS